MSEFAIYVIKSSSITYLCEAELVRALCDAPLCCLHVLRFFGSLEQQSLFILNSHATLKAERGRP